MELAIALGVFTAGMFLSEKKNAPFEVPDITYQTPETTSVEVCDPFSENRFNVIAPFYKGSEPLGTQTYSDKLDRLQGAAYGQRQEVDGHLFQADIPLLPRNQVGGFQCNVDRAIQGLKKTTDNKPFEPEMVAHVKIDRQLPKTIDEIRVANNPKITYNKPSQHGYSNKVGQLDTCYAENPFDNSSKGRELFPAGMGSFAEIAQNIPTHRDIDTTMKLTPIENRSQNVVTHNFRGNTCKSQDAQNMSFFSTNTKKGILVPSSESQGRQRLEIGAAPIGTPQCNLKRMENVQPSFVLPETNLFTKDITDGNITGQSATKMQSQMDTSKGKVIYDGHFGPSALKGSQQNAPKALQESKSKMVVEGHVGTSSLMGSLFGAPKPDQTTKGKMVVDGHVGTSSLMGSLFGAPKADQTTKGKMVVDGHVGTSSLLGSLFGAPKADQSSKGKMVVEGHVGTSSLMGSLFGAPKADQTTKGKMVVEGHVGLSAILASFESSPEPQVDIKGQILQEGRLGLSSIMKSMGLQEPESQITKTYEQLIFTPSLGAASLTKAETSRNASVENTFELLHVENHAHLGGTQIESGQIRDVSTTLKTPLEASNVPRSAPLINQKAPIQGEIDLRDETPNVTNYGLPDLSRVYTESSSMTTYTLAENNEPSNYVSSVGHIKQEGAMRPESTRPETITCSEPRT
jgi:hypothetical protein